MTEEIVEVTGEIVEMPVLSTAERTEPALYFRYRKTAFVIPNECEES
jgi:hypothetical protein